MNQPPVRPRAVPDHPAGRTWQPDDLEAVQARNAAGAATGLVLVGVVAACLLPVLGAAAGVAVVIYRAIAG